MDTRKTALWVIAILIVSVMVPAMAMASQHDDGDDADDNSGPGNADDRGDGNETADGDDADGNETADDRRDDDGNRSADDARSAEGRERAERARLMGRLAFDNGTATGAFVSFMFDEDTGAVSDWTYQDLLVLDELAFGDWNQSELRVHGSVFEAEAEWEDAEDGETLDTTSASSSHDDGNETDDGDDSDGNETADGDDADGNETGTADNGNETADGDTSNGNETADGDMADGNETDDGDDDAPDRRIRVRLHDNPTGFIKLDLRGTHDVSWTFADGVNVNQTGNWTVELTADNGTFHAFLWKDRDDKEAGFDVDGQTVTLSVMDKANVMFRVGASSRGPGPGLDIPEGGDDDADDDRARGLAIARAASEGRVGAEISLQAMNGTPAADVAAYDGIEVEHRAERGRVDVTVSFDGPAKTIVVKVAKDLVDASDPADVTVLFDGEEIPQAASLADVLDPTDDDSAEYVVVVGAAGTEVLVSVPEWSPHTVTVQEAAGDAVTPLPAPGALAALGALLAAAGVAAVLRRRRTG